MSTERVRTSPTVAIVGGGPAGLMLSHLLARRGIATTVIDIRTRHEIETTHRAGILEADSVRMLVDHGVSDRVLREGDEHEGIELRFGGVSHRIDFKELVGESVWLYPQTDVFIDLADARARDDGEVYFGVRDVEVSADELARRRAERDALGWKPRDRRRTVSNALKIYASLAQSADKGAARRKLD